MRKFRRFSGQKVKSGMKESEIKIEPEKIFFRNSGIMMEVSQNEKCRIPYRDIVWAYVKTGKDGEEKHGEPGLADITESTKGDLIVYDRRHFGWTIGTGRVDREAGALLKELCLHAPYIVAGGQDWFDDSEDTDFGMVEEMVELMRACGKG